jgi:hypothetical protein
MPANTMTTATTDAKIGRVMKKSTTYYFAPQSSRIMHSAADQRETRKLLTPRSIP